MDPITILTIGIGLASTLLQEAKKLGLVADESWSKYVDGGLHAMQTATQIVAHIADGSTSYDGLTAEEIEALLLPAEWSASEVRRLADEKAAAEGV